MTTTPHVDPPEPQLSLSASPWSWERPEYRREVADLLLAALDAYDDIPEVCDIVTADTMAGVIRIVVRFGEPGDPRGMVVGHHPHMPAALQAHLTGFGDVEPATVYEVPAAEAARRLALYVHWQA